jgi:hypothetical protein
MFQLRAYAWQTKSGIAVDIHAMLENGCKRASVTGEYPGRVVHIQDPGYAEIFITETTLPGPCTEAIVPWHAYVLLPDFMHKRVAIFVDGKRRLVVPVVGAQAYAKATAVGARNWIVAAIFNSTKPPYEGCRTFAKNQPLPKLFHKVYGPNTFAACEAFRRKNCRASSR